MTLANTVRSGERSCPDDRERLGVFGIVEAMMTCGSWRLAIDHAHSEAAFVRTPDRSPNKTSGS